MTREKAVDLVYDLIQATRDYERRPGDKYYRDDFCEVREAVIVALTAHPLSAEAGG